MVGLRILHALQYEVVPALFLWRLDIEAIEASISELDAILVVLVKGVPGNLQCGQIPGAYSRGRLSIYAPAETCRPELSRPAGMAQSA